MPKSAASRPSWNSRGVRPRRSECELRREFDARVVMAMRYWRPFTEEAIATMAAHAPDEVVLLPLYPQYSKTTTGSSLNEWNRRFQPNGWSPRVHVVREFYRRRGVPGFRGRRHRRIRSRDFEDPADVDMVFSAHSVPVAVIEQGDPYQRQIEAHGRSGVAARRLAGAAARLLPEQSRRVEMAAAVDARDRQEPGGGGIAARAGGADFVCLRSRRDAARDRYRASRTGARAGDYRLTV